MEGTYKGDSGGINHSTKHTDIMKLNIEQIMQRVAFRIHDKFYNKIIQILCNRLCTFCKYLSSYADEKQYNLNQTRFVGSWVAYIS